MCNEKGDYLSGLESPWGKPRAQTEAREIDQAGEREQGEAEMEELSKWEVLSPGQPFRTQGCDRAGVRYLRDGGPPAPLSP